MGKDYCGVDDILEVVPEYRKDVIPETASGEDESIFQPNTGTIPRGDIEKIVSEASEMVRLKLQPRYDITVIDAYDPNFPPVLAYYTAAYGALLVMERYGAQNVSMNAEVVKRVERSIQTYRQIIAGGVLLDTTGVKVPTVVNPRVTLGSTNTDFTADEKLKECYEDGRDY